MGSFAILRGAESQFFLNSPQAQKITHSPHQKRPSRRPERAFDQAANPRSEFLLNGNWSQSSGQARLTLPVNGNIIVQDRIRPRRIQELVADLNG